MRGKLTGFLLMTGAIAVASAFAVMAAGWTTNGSGEQVYQNADGSIVKNSWIKADNNGTTAWYYATNNGALKVSAWQKVGDSYYYFDDYGVMQTGWVDDYKYYCNPSNGAMITGWKQLTIPDEYQDNGEDYTSGENAWFYFNPSNGEKVASEDDDVLVRKIDGTAYGFDENGVMTTGWAKTEDKTPELAGYCYFAEKTDSKFKLGQRVEGTWYTTYGPTDDDGDTDTSLATGDVEYFYFKSNGHPVVGGSEVCLVERINGKIFLFNKYGNPATGLQYGSKDINVTTSDADVYYCGDSKSNSSATTGKKISVTDDGGESITILLQSNAKGVTGERSGYLYYQGKLQKAETGSKYMICVVDGEQYVVNQSGFVMKNKTKLKDADGNIMNTSSSGAPENYNGDTFESFTAAGPEIDTDDL